SAPSDWGTRHCSRPAPPPQPAALPAPQPPWRDQHHLVPTGPRETLMGAQTGRNSGRLPGSSRALPAPATARVGHARREHLSTALREIAKATPCQNILGHQMLHAGARINDPHRAHSPLLLRYLNVRNVGVAPVPACHALSLHVGSRLTDVVARLADRLTAT